MTGHPTHLGRRLARAALAAILLSMVGGPAAAQEETTPAGTNGLELSSDGTAFRPRLSQPLFPDPPLLVPGQSVADRLWVRNASSESAVVSLYVVDIDSSLPSSVGRQDDFQLRGQTQDRQVTTEAVSALDPCSPVVQAALPPGESAEIALEVALPITSDNVSQRQSMALDFVIDLRPQVDGGSRCGAAPDPTPDPNGGDEAQDPGNAAPPPGARADGQLPRTGSSVQQLLILAILAVLAGALLRGAGRVQPPSPTTPAGGSQCPAADGS